MEDKPNKVRLSLKKNNQRKLDFFKPKTQNCIDTAIKELDEDETSDTSGPPLSGLCNLGNTCYVNSLLQTLRFCPTMYDRVKQLNDMLTQQENESSKLTNGVVNGVGGSRSSPEPMECPEPNKEPANEKKPVFLAVHLYTLWQRMLQKEKTFIRTTNKVNILRATRPDAFIVKLKEDHPVFDNKLQQDAQEMLRYLLTNLHETCTSTLQHQPPSSSTKEPLPEFISQTINGTVVPTTVIDVDSYHCAGEDTCSSSKHPVIGKKRKLLTGKLSNVVPKMLKPTKASKYAAKPLTDFFNPVKKQLLSQEQQLSIDCGTSKETVSSREVKPHKVDFVSAMFQGTLAYQTKCFECENCTRRTEEFLDISVPMTNSSPPGFPPGTSPVKSVQENGHVRSSSTVGPNSLSWALSQFALREKLRRENKYFCDSCCHFVEAERSMLFSHLPNIVTIHLNRFATQVWGLSSSVTVNKVTGNIAIPLSLCLKPWCTDDCKDRDRIYELFSVVFHSGTSCSSGHYTSCVRAKECLAIAPSGAHIEQDKWLYFDDDLVEYLPQHKLLEMLSPLSNDSCTPYILFYR